VTSRFRHPTAPDKNFLILAPVKFKIKIRVSDRRGTTTVDVGRIAQSLRRVKAEEGSMLEILFVKSRPDAWCPDPLNR